MSESDQEKIDVAVLGLLFLTFFRKQKGLPWRAWKGHDWDALDRLHSKEMILDPLGKTKSVVLTEEGRKLSEKVFARLFCEGEDTSA